MLICLKDDTLLSCSRHLAGYAVVTLTIMVLMCSCSAKTQVDAGVSNASQNASKATASSTGENKVLRHAVFIGFKKTANDSDIQQIVHTFHDLPSKIDSIIDFEWGTNNSKEGFDDGFTHCFLLTFKNEAGRAAYLPHEDHKAFGKMLRPHMEQVFVIDYWGVLQNDPIEKELKHAVFLKFKDDLSSETITNVEKHFATLPSTIVTIKAFEWGTNNSPESHDAGFTHCFMLSFDSEDGRSRYLPHPDHIAFVDVLKPVVEKVRVLDFWVQR